MDSTQEKKLSPEEIELNWYKNVYQGDHMPQLTLRAVIMGSLLGGFMSLSNLYVGLKTGWALGVAITACILSFAIYKTMRTLFPKWFPTDMSILENNCMQSTASSAGYSTGGTMVSAIAAYLIVTGHHMHWTILAAWTFCLAALGVFMAIPMKRQMINIEQLKFPSGIAAAETLKSLHAAGQDAVDKARSLGIAGFLGGVIAWFRDAALPAAMAIPGFAHFPGKILGLPLIRWTIGFEMSAIMIAAGAIVGWKIAWSLLLGAFINYGLLAPAMVNMGAIDTVNLSLGTLMPALMGKGWQIIASVPVLGESINAGLAAFWAPFQDLHGLLMLDKAGFRTAVNQTLVPLLSSADGGEAAIKLSYRTIVGWSTWAGASIMVASGLLAFALQWHTVLRAFSGLFDIFSTKKKADNDPLAAIEVPTSWFVSGMIVSGLGCMAVLHYAFDTTFFMGIVAVICTFFLAIVACRATGESDITPVGAMGKITQLVFGVLAPSNLVTNLMTASVTAGAAGSSADLLTDLKSGYLLGANPRRQFLAQLFGIIAGTLVVVPAFYLLVPNAEVLGSDRWPAPSAQVWAAVARLLASGLGALHETARWGIFIGCLVGIALVLLSEYAPKKLKPFIPSATGIGLAMVIPFYNSLSMFMGAALAMMIEHRSQTFADKYIIPVASGVIAGESIMGIVVALLTATGVIGG
ncbi:MAG TPA: OPT family oligopeptide transporter [Candidatus Ozemobacteraceae bacterium]|nr:OPT family oligopeptide transporter [Candidatus Ozemobacteraceae bacterium]